MLTVAVGCALGGCAALSGLDRLSVGEQDATLESGDSGFESSASDSPHVADATATLDAVACAYTSGPQQCFQDACAAPCCVTSGQATCTPLPCGGGISLGCTSPSDCASSTQPVCCLEGYGTPVAGCPLAIPYDGGTTTACVQAGMCITGGPSGQRLCVSDDDCPTGQHCVQAAFTLNLSKVFGLCR